MQHFRPAPIPLARPPGNQDSRHHIDVQARTQVSTTTVPSVFAKPFFFSQPGMQTKQQTAHASPSDGRPIAKQKALPLHNIFQASTFSGSLLTLDYVRTAKSLHLLTRHLHGKPPESAPYPPLLMCKFGGHNITCQDGNKKPQKNGLHPESCGRWHVCNKPRKSASRKAPHPTGHGMIYEIRLERAACTHTPTTILSSTLLHTVVPAGSKG